MREWRALPGCREGPSGPEAWREKVKLAGVTPRDPQRLKLAGKSTLAHVSAGTAGCAGSGRGAAKKLDEVHEETCLN